MNHCSDDDLVLQHYGESPEADAHVAVCASCAARARELATLLETVTDDAVPERDDRYGAEVWLRIRPHLVSSAADPVRSSSSNRRIAHLVRSSSLRWTLAAAATLALIATGFFAGRFSMPQSGAVPADLAATRTAVDSDDPQLARRVLLLSVADHLERSDRVLTDIMNTPGADISAEQQWAGDLIATNRLFRQDALDARESSVADVLDELERALLDIVHRPADAHADLDQIRERIDSEALLFKVRVMSDELRQRQFRSVDDDNRREPDSNPGARSTTPIS